MTILKTEDDDPIELLALPNMSIEKVPPRAGGRCWVACNPKAGDDLAERRLADQVVKDIGYLGQLIEDDSIVVLQRPRAAQEELLNGVHVQELPFQPADAAQLPWLALR
ncbi:MAG TPA: hypothetical protein DCS55_21875 [Acidimicrobiaceae bacterium]|nr:hypothetical protein [Acidimicrobiaceae bacterium]